MDPQKKKAIKKKDNKIIKFSVDDETYFQRATDYYAENNYFKSLEYLNRALELFYDPEYIFMRAQIFSEMGLYKRSNFEFFKLLYHDDYVGECYLKISQNFFMLKDMESALHYFRRCLDYDFDEDSDDFIDMEDLMNSIVFSDEQEKGLKILSNDKDDENLIYLANLLMSDYQFEEAVQYLDKIKPESPHYLSALNHKGFCVGRSGNPELEVDYSLQVLSREPNNIYALCNLSDAYVLLGDRQRAAEVAHQLLKIAITDENDYYKVAVALLESGFLKEAISYLSKYLIYYPYHESAILLLSMAYYNNGQIEEARSCIFKLICIDPKDLIIKNIYKAYLSERYEPIQYSRQLSREKAEEYLNGLIEAFSSHEKTIKAIKHDEQFFSKLMWYLPIGNEALLIDFFYKLAYSKDKRAINFLKECLLSSTIQDAYKKYILKLLLQIKTRKIIFLLGKDVKIIIPKFYAKAKDYPEEFLIAAAEVYSWLVYLEEDFESRFARAFGRFLNKCETHKNELTDVKALSALFAYMLGKNKQFRDKERVCMLFDVQKETLIQYANLIGVKI